MLVNIKVTGGLNIESGHIYPKATGGWNIESGQIDPKATQGLSRQRRGRRNTDFGWVILAEQRTASGTLQHGLNWPPLTPAVVSKPEMAGLSLCNPPSEKCGSLWSRHAVVILVPFILTVEAAWMYKCSVELNATGTTCYFMIWNNQTRWSLISRTAIWRNASLENALHSILARKLYNEWDAATCGLCVPLVGPLLACYSECIKNEML